MRFGVPTVGPDLVKWAEDMRRWLGRTWDRLTYREAGAVAVDDGIILWDATGYPVVSKGGAWRQIVLADGYAWLAIASDVTAASADTAYALSWDAPSVIGEIDVSGSEVTFNEDGKYLVTFTAQIQSTSASTVDFLFWPRINGTNAAGSTMVASLHNNGATLVVSRTALFPMSAGDVLEAFWAVTNTSGLLKAHGATAYAPAAPAVTMAIARASQ